MNATTTTTVHDAVAGLCHGLDRDVVDDDRLVEDLAIDSMAKLELAAALEERLGRPVADAIVMKARTVGDLVVALGG